MHKNKISANQIRLASNNQRKQANDTVKKWTQPPMSANTKKITASVVAEQKRFSGSHRQNWREHVHKVTTKLKKTNRTEKVQSCSTHREPLTTYSKHKRSRKLARKPHQSRIRQKPGLLLVNLNRPEYKIPVQDAPD